MLDIGAIRCSCSPWASAVVFVWKKDGSLRFCIDLRHLNSHTIKDAYSLPRIEGSLDCDRYRVPKFPHSSATFNIISGFCILASPKVLQGAFGNSACPTWCSQPCPMLANRHLTGLTWFPIVLCYIK